MCERERRAHHCVGILHSGAAHQQTTLTAGSALTMALPISAEEQALRTTHKSRESASCGSGPSRSRLWPIRSGDGSQLLPTLRRRSRLCVRDGTGGVRGEAALSATKAVRSDAARSIHAREQCCISSAAAC